MEIKAREPLSRSSQPGGNIDTGKSAGGPMVSTPLYGVGQGTNSNIQDVEEAQKARGSLERGTKPPSTLGTANPQSPSTAHQYTSPKGPVLQLPIPLIQNSKTKHKINKHFIQLKLQFSSSLSFPASQFF
jgi:hypothetical protein